MRDFEVAGNDQVTLDLSLQPIGPVPGDEPPPKALGAIPVSLSKPSPVTAVALPPPAPPHDSVPTSNTQLIIGYSSAAAGAALLIGGRVLAWVGKDKADTAQNKESDAANNKDPNSWDIAQSDLQSAKTLNTLGWAGVGVGAAALAGGLVLVVSAPKSQDGHALAVTPWKTAQTTGASAQFVW